MIVRDEAHVVERCLRSVLPHVDAVAVVDTGSTDGTQRVVADLCHAIEPPCTSKQLLLLEERPWVDFATNRNQALDLARASGCDYALVIDADEELVSDRPYSRLTESLLHDADAYAWRLRLARGDCSWVRRGLVRLSRPWAYHDEIHERLELHEDQTLHFLDDFWVLSHDDSARNRLGREEKCRRDAEVIRRMVERDPSEPRYLYYLGLALSGAGDVDGAIAAHRRRVAMGGWGEEVYASLFQVATLLAAKRDLLLERDGGSSVALDLPTTREVCNAYLDCVDARAHRAEPLWALAVHHNEAGEYGLAELYARAGCMRPKPADSLVVHESVYEWRCADELAGALARLGRGDEALTFMRELERYFAGRTDGEAEHHLRRVRENIRAVEGGELE